MRNITRTRTALMVASLATVASLALTVATATPAGAVAGFGDVDEDLFYTDAVGWMVGEEITTGIAPGCFGPTQQVTRGDVAAFMYRLETALGRHPGSAPHPFTDVTAAYQQDPVGWMYSTGITTGTSALTFSPDKPITRGDFATMLWRHAGRPAARAPQPFGDVHADYQQSAIAWMAERGITTGTSPTTFQPDGFVTRAEAAAFLFRYVDPGEVDLTGAEESCSSELRLTLIAGGLTATEATCAAPLLTHFDVDYMLAVLEGRATVTVPLLVAVADVGAECLTPARIGDLSRLLF